MDLEVLERYRNVAIVGAYALLASGITITLAATLWRRSRNLRAPSRLSLKRLLLFSGLALASLAVIATFAYSFVLRSYHDWLQQAYPPYTEGPAALPLFARLMRSIGWETLPEKRLKQQHIVGGVAVSLQLIDEWLGAPGRLLEAGAIASATPARFWWTQQLLSILPWWTLFLGWQGRRYRVSYVWAFMFLAQGLSVSFAINLFFVAVILSPIGNPAKVSKSSVVVEKTELQDGAVTKKQDVALKERTNYLDTSQISDSPLVAWTLFLSVVVAMASVPFIPAFIGTDYFITALTLPHLLVYLPTLLPTTTPENLWATYKALFVGMIVVQLLTTTAVLAGVDIRGSAGTAIDFATSTINAGAALAGQISRAALDSRFGLISRHSWTERLLPGRWSPLDYASSRLDHYILSLNTWAPAQYHALQQTATNVAQTVWSNPSILYTWSQMAVDAIQGATNSIWYALFEHPVVTGVGADTLMCWVSITAWIVTSSGFDDELAEESIEPVLEAQETIKGLQGQNGRPGVPVRTSWFESHIG